MFMPAGDENDRRAQRKGHVEDKGRRSGASKRKGRKKEQVRTTSNRGIPDLEEYLSNQDFSGALALCEFNLKSGEVVDVEHALMWIGYCAFHKGAYERAISAYEQLLNTHLVDVSHRKDDIYCLLACCHYFVQQYKEAALIVEKVTTDCAIKNRILSHVAKKMGNSSTEDAPFMVHDYNLSDSREDQLSKAALHYLSGHYQEALDIYKQMLQNNCDDIGLNVYLSMCYYKLEYYELSIEVLSIYLQAIPDSFSAINLKACNLFQLHNGRAAMKAIKSIENKGHELEGSRIKTLIEHNVEVFDESCGVRLKNILPLVDFVPEARFNAAVYYIKNGAIQEAYRLVEKLKPQATHEYVLNAVASAYLGQKTGDLELLRTAQQHFQLVGASSSECDTVIGRQCMASCFFLLKQFEDVIVYLNSIKAYLRKDDAFNWNYGISLAEMGNFKEAEEILLQIQNEEWKSEYSYIAWLAHCYIMNGSPDNAWELYLKMETSEESFNILHLIANDCYRMGQFWISAKAFDDLHRLDPGPEYWKGLCGACVGVFQLILAGKSTEEELEDIIPILRAENTPQVEFMVSTMIRGLDFTITKN